MVDENFHYMDPEARWTRGEFATAEEALSVCRRMVNDDLAALHKPGMSATAYKALGDDPFVVSLDGPPEVAFSAWDYADERCRVICG